MEKPSARPALRQGQDPVRFHSVFPSLKRTVLCLQVLQTVVEVERPLVQDRLRNIDARLREAQENLKWNSPGVDFFPLFSSPVLSSPVLHSPHSCVSPIHSAAVGVWQYIQEVRDSVCDLEHQLQRSKDNVEEIQKILRSWVVPLYGRKENKKDSLLSLEDRTDRLNRFYSLIQTSGEKIHFLLKVDPHTPSTH